ncbi:alpha/beta fold hydrolase [Aureimonas mangrovi]|uniref:alpha/beta fold hydrolase n=1 Tax=Aureimonas mangrovi TaxID=2758041 RepID=UPI001FE9ABF3|nr:alpha/beta fold hydrolase [Aureimonas mangrovi]
MPAFFVHGAPDTHHVWDPIRDHLHDHDSVAVDLPGFGCSVPPGFEATKEAYVTWLIARIAEIGEPVDIVGHDWGCVLSLRVASLRPDLIRSWAAGDGPLNADYVWHPLAKIFQTPGLGEEYIRNFSPSQFEKALLDDGVPASIASQVPMRVDAVMGECLLKL